MNNSQADIFFDFSEEYLQEREVFLDYLQGENWNKLNSENNWRKNFTQSLTTKEQFNIIKKEIELASKISKIKSIDYIVISDEAVYYNKVD